MHESHCQLRQAFALKGGHTGHTHPNYHQMVLLSNLRKDIEKSHRERKKRKSHGTERLRSDGFHFPFLASDYHLTSFYSEMCSLEFSRLDWWFFSLFLQHSFLRMAPLWLTGWSGGDSMSLQQNKTDELGLWSKSFEVKMSQVWGSHHQLLSEGNNHQEIKFVRTERVQAIRTC